MRMPCIPLLLIVFLSPKSVAQAPPPNPPGRLVNIGGYRLHLNCTGRGSPTVLLEYGASGNSMVWALVQPEVARFTRVCSYDRAYEGWSDAGPIPQTMHQQVYELHKVLGAAHIRPPYVLVGWSLGGMIDRLYVDAYPTEVKGKHQENSCSSLFFSSSPCSLITTTGSVSEILARRDTQNNPHLPLRTSSSHIDCCSHTHRLAAL
jgi:pimeloyl-ACP methyl ester carboxylesterase